MGVALSFLSSLLSILLLLDLKLYSVYYHTSERTVVSHIGDPDVFLMALNNDVNGINAATIKLPTFWSKEPDVWFIQAESQFTIRGITSDETKYHYLVSALDSVSAGRVRDVLKNPPATEKYKTLKDVLERTFSYSEEKRAASLLELPELGDTSASELMDKMLGLLGDHPPCFLFKHLFLRCLPEDVRATLVHSKIEDMRALALAADELIQVKGVSCSATFQRSSTSKKKNYSTHEKRNTDVCFFHRRFGKSAQKCVLPCTFGKSTPITEVTCATTSENESAGCC